MIPQGPPWIPLQFDEIFPTLLIFHTINNYPNYINRNIIQIQLQQTFRLILLKEINMISGVIDVMTYFPQGKN